MGLVEFSDAVVQDDIDRLPGYLLFTPALTRVLLAAGTNAGISWYGLQLDNGTRDVAAVEHEISSQPRHGETQFHVTSLNEAQRRVLSSQTGSPWPRSP